MDMVFNNSIKLTIGNKMAILSISPVIIGNVGDSPREWKILTNNTYSEVIESGFLSQYQSVYNFANSDYAIVYTTDLLDVLLNITVSGSVVSLVNTYDSSVITYPVTQNHIAVFTSTSSSSSTIGDDPAIALNGGDIQAGFDSVQGKLRSYPATTTTGYLEVFSTSSSGNYGIGVTNASFGQSSVISIPDPGASTASFVLNSGTNTMASGSRIVFSKVAGTESGSAVTLNGTCGAILTSSLTTASGSSYSFVWTNSSITSSSVINASWQGGTSTGGIPYFKIIPGSGAASVLINNIGSSAFNGTIIMSFFIS